MEWKRNSSLDALKIMGTVLIIFHHYQQTTGAFFQNGINFFGGRFYFGYIVELFFVISGYVMYRYIQRIKMGMTFREYILKRASRLLPLVFFGAVIYEIMLFIYQKLYQEYWSGGIQMTLWGTIIDALGIQDGWALANPYVNNPTWYISVLMLCYVIFYLLTYLSKRCEVPAIYLYVAMIFLGWGIDTYGINLPFLNWSACRGYYAFFFGIILGGYLADHEINKRTATAAACVAGSMIYLIVFHYSLVSNGIQYLLTYILYPSLIIVFQSKGLKQLLNTSVVEWLGKISFGVYIWHNPLFIVMYAVIKIFNVSINLLTYKAMAVYTLICFGVGIISYYCLEKPINKWMEAKIKKLQLQKKDRVYFWD